MSKDLRRGCWEDPLREECAREKEAAVQEVTPNTWTVRVLKEKEPLLH